MSAVMNSPHARDVACVLHPMTDPSKHEKDGPLILEEGHGIYVKDLEGNEYIEGMAGLWCTSLGFNNERLIEAAVAQMRKLPTYHTFFHRSNMPAIDLAEKMLSIAPVPMSKVWFANSGSEANDHMVKFVWFYNNAVGRPEKKKIIARHGGYHGIAVSSGSLTGLTPMHKGFDLPIAGILHTGSAHYYRYGLPGESEEAFSARRAAELEAMIVEEGPETVAAFVAEPVMGAGGAITPPRGYFAAIQAVLKKYDVLMVADEVITGFYRTGNTFACETYGIEPDIIINAKQLSSAYLPISSVMLNEKIYGAIRDYASANSILGTGFTYSGHPVAAAVAVETLKIYDEIDIASHVNAVSKVAQERLSALADHPLVGDAKGVGLIGSVELVKNKETKESFDPQVAAWASEACTRRGVMLRPCAGTRIAFCPPLIIEDDEVHMLFDRWQAALDDTLEYVRAEELM
ncbi:MAG: aminotransferase class III-fold pyridoxal phosphate-dependent enzyme [Gammaproteobacteria bacterium]|nr:aminotransferase class III-fold pyridoxal phosphate-dependent enzyme [Gammaproteobacteria bacterium]